MKNTVAASLSGKSATGDLGGGVFGGVRPCRPELDHELEEVWLLSELVLSAFSFSTLANSLTVNDGKLLKKKIFMLEKGE